MRALEADWIVVGGGSSGCVIAGRLSEDPAVNVLLLEAGPDWRPDEVPQEIRARNTREAMEGEAGRRFRWQGLTARRTSAQPAMPYRQGKGVGGSSIVNGLVALRPPVDDYERWEASGCPGWSFDEMLPHLCGLEDDADFGGEPYHGDGGPVPLARVARDGWGPLDAAFGDSALGLGYGWCDDHNAPTGTGVSPVAMVVRDGLRVTMNDAYIEPARGRPNLQVVGGALVDRVLLAGGRAVGVRASLDGRQVDVHARQVVLCAGAIHSPAILLRSGVGPTGPVVRLPVGEGLQDHGLIAFWLHLRPQAQPGNDDWLTTSRLRYSSGLDGGGANDMAMGTVNQTGTGATGTGPTGPGFLFLCLHQQASRGNLRLASSDPRVPPLIDERLLEEGADLHRMRDGVRRAIELLAQPAFTAVVEQVTLDAAGRGIDALRDDAAVDRWLLENLGGGSHVCSTCRMGAADDPCSVVDPSGRVFGIDGLWVADASIFPEVPRANTHLPAIATAERIADLIVNSRPAQPLQHNRA